LTNIAAYLGSSTIYTHIYYALFIGSHIFSVELSNPGGGKNFGTPYICSYHLI